MKLTDVKAGMRIRSDEGFICMMSGPKIVFADEKDRLYVNCMDGKHYLKHQEDDNGDLIGFTPLENA